MRYLTNLPTLTDEYSAQFSHHIILRIRPSVLHQKAWPIITKLLCTPRLCSFCCSLVHMSPLHFPTRFQELSVSRFCCDLCSIGVSSAVRRATVTFTVMFARVLKPKASRTLIAGSGRCISMKFSVASKQFASNLITVQISSSSQPTKHYLCRRQTSLGDPSSQLLLFWSAPRCAWYPFGPLGISCHAWSDHFIYLQQIFIQITPNICFRNSSSGCSLHDSRFLLTGSLNAT